MSEKERQDVYESALKRLIRDEISDLIDEKFDKHAEQEDARWKEIKTAIDIMNDFKGFATIGGWVLKVVIMLGSAVSAVYYLTHKLK